MTFGTRSLCCLLVGCDSTLLSRRDVVLVTLWPVERGLAVGNTRADVDGG